MPVKRVIYAASVMREEEFAALFDGGHNIPGQQAQKFNRLMVAGIEKNGAEAFVISAPPVTAKNCARRLVALGQKRIGNTVYRYLPILNLPRIKNPLVILSSFFHTLFAAAFRKSAVVCDVLNVSVAMGAVAAGRLLHKPCVGIVTDVPELMVTGHTDKQVRFCHKIIENCTHYVFLTEAMNERLNPDRKPYTIIEGVCNEDLSYEDRPSAGERICFYAGLLDAEYGVKTMVDAFRRAAGPGARLQICGKGPYAEELARIAAEDPSVEYLGTLMNSEVVALEKKAALLINPRPSVGEFTKFSFPSKVMEYMTSGTAVFATKLPGIPEEYYHYIYPISDESEEGMAESLRNVLSLSDEELIHKGRLAYRFVTENKSAAAQASKLLSLMAVKSNA